MKNKTSKKNLRDILEVVVALSVIGIPMFAAGFIVGSCSKRKNNCTPDKGQNILIIEENIEPNSEKVFEEGKHILSVRISYSNSDNTANYVINNIPEGYEVFDIESCNNKSKLQEYDVWFVNTEKVKVYATYDESSNKYGYYTFGIPVEEEKTLAK